MKFPITPTVKNHGKISGVIPINLSESHCHKITVTKGTTIIPLKIIINNMQVHHELEIKVE